MIEQHDLDRLQASLEALRGTMMSNRELAGKQLESLLAESESLREAAAGGKYEAAVGCVHDLLRSLHDGLAAQNHLNRLTDSQATA